MIKMSEKRTYILNDELLYITKVRKDAKDETKYNVTYENLITKEVKTVTNDDLKDAVKTIDSTEFFAMWCHFNNWQRNDEDHEYVKKHARKVIDHLMLNKIELHGSNKFEKYDLNHIVEMYNYVYAQGFFCGPTVEWSSIYDMFDSGYTYHLLLTQEEKDQVDKQKWLVDEMNSMITEEINREIIEHLQSKDLPLSEMWVK